MKTPDAGFEKEVVSASVFRAVVSLERCSESLRKCEKSATTASPGMVGRGVALGKFVSMMLWRVWAFAFPRKRSMMFPISGTMVFLGDIAAR